VNGEPLSPGRLYVCRDQLTWRIVQIILCRCYSGALFNHLPSKSSTSLGVALVLLCSCRIRASPPLLGNIRFYRARSIFAPVLSPFCLFDYASNVFSGSQRTHFADFGYPRNPASPSQLYRRTLSTRSFFTYPASVALTDLQSPLLNCKMGKLVRIPLTLVKSCNEKLQKVWSKSARSEGVIEMAETSRREG
jgi:hypothetical protein